jgi:hypothetical protein
MMTLPRSFADAMMFGFTASLTLWADLAPAEMAMMLATVFGVALIALHPDQASDMGVRS